MPKKITKIHKGSSSLFRLDAKSWVGSENGEWRLENGEWAFFKSNLKSVAREIVPHAHDHIVINVITMYQKVFFIYQKVLYQKDI